MEILSKCPQCKGMGRVRRELPFGANPKAPMTNADKTGYKTCPRCNGSGSIGIRETDSPS